MTEKDVENQFCQFLVESKKFPTTSLLRQAPTYALGTGGTLRVDLLLLDVKIGEYIGVVEFKGAISPKVKESAARQLQRYREIIKSPDLPSYLVHPYDGKDFQIQVFSEGAWSAITKEEFPEFETLSAKKKIEEKVIAREAEQNIVVEVHKQEKKQRLASLIGLVSLLIGIVAAWISFVQAGDSLTLFAKDDPEMHRIRALEAEVHELRQIISHHPTSVDTLHVIDSSSTFSGLAERLRIIEDGLMNEPDKILSLSNLRNELRVHEETLRGQEKLLSARYENILTRIEWLNAVVIGLVVSVFAAAIGFVITTYSDKRKVASRLDRPTP